MFLNTKYCFLKNKFLNITIKLAFDCFIAINVGLFIFYVMI